MKEMVDGMVRSQQPSWSDLPIDSKKDCLFYKIAVDGIECATK